VAETTMRQQIRDIYVLMRYADKLEHFRVAQGVVNLMLESKKKKNGRLD